MQLRKLEIIGFKSFNDRTVIKFDHDVTGIVGPNGCGKSNIVDAIRWCMGEQSAKHLRGRSMEDVIFNGSESRGPAGFAEVTLTFDNTDGLTPVEYRDYPEIAVTRRLHRNGDSDYLINKTQVRLKDVTDLFLGTGAGTKAYAIVEQGKVGLIVSSKPEDRRILIEEAAGITKYKSKRKQAERKMELTQQNLLRVGDILTELEKSCASLERQAKKAERYLALRAELDDLVLHEAAHRYLGLIVTRQYAGGALTEWTKVSTERRTALVAKDAELETLRLQAHQAESVLEAAQAEHYARDNEVRALEGEIVRARDVFTALRTREIDARKELSLVANEKNALANEQQRFQADLVQHKDDEIVAAEALAEEEERLQSSSAHQQEAERKVTELRRRAADAGARMARAEAALAGFDRRRNDLEARRTKLYAEREELEARQIESITRVEELRRQVDELRESRTTSKEQRQAHEERLSVFKRDVIESEKLLDQRKNELSKNRSRMHALLEVQSRLEGVGQGVRWVVQRRDPSVLGMLADFLAPPPHLTQALAAALGDTLQCLVISDEERALVLARSLRDEKKGRAAFLPRTHETASPKEAPASVPADLLQSGAVLGRLADLVDVRAEERSLVAGVLDGFVVARDLEAARELRRQAPEGFRAIVTLEGEVLHADGRLVAGDREQLLAGMLESRRETRELSEIVRRLDAEVTELVTRHQTLRTSINETQSLLEAVRQTEHRGELALVGAEKDLRGAEQDLNRSRTRLETLMGEVSDIAEQIAEAGSEQATAREEVTLALEERSALDVQIQDAERDSEGRRAELDARRQVVTERKVQMARAREKTRGIEGALERLSRSVRELGEREARLETELLASAAKQGESAGTLFRCRERLEDAVVLAKQCQEALAAAKGVYDAARGEMAHHEVALKGLRQEADAAEKSRVEHELRVRELGIELRSLLESVAEKFRGLELPRIIGDYHLREIPGDAHRARVQELGGILDRLGAVNLDAKREFQETKKRHDDVKAQKDDLDKALADLQKAIEQMDRESRRLFKETFDAVSERFQKLFPLMFRGGRASLVLTNPDDLLETGIEILAQPPGKKIGNIELMSGGEKALTAVSLIFSIFQIRPSPFCILDEVDAPLDEANVARYNEAIRTMTERSQFILITHIKRTMQMVDVLYGVTMPEPGVSALTSVDLSALDGKKAERKPAPAMASA